MQMTEDFARVSIRHIIDVVSFARLTTHIPVLAFEIQHFLFRQDIDGCCELRVIFQVDIVYVPETCKCSSDIPCDYLFA